MMDSLARFAVHFDVNETPGAELVPKPALRWTNTISSTHDGMVGVYAKDAGRPDAVVQFSLKGD
jgi:hypothetical protein